MYRSFKLFLAPLAVVVLMLAQILPASALIIHFTTGTPAIKILSSSPSPGSSGLCFTPAVTVTFSRATVTLGARLYKYSDHSAQSPGGSIGGGTATIGVSLDTNILEPNTQYYMEFWNINDSDGNTLDSSDPANAPYWDTTAPPGASSGAWRLYFTTAPSAGWNTASLGGVAGSVTGSGTAVNVSVNAVLRVVPNNTIDSSTVNGTHVILHKDSPTGTSVTCSVALSQADGKTISVTPSAPLEYSTDYYLELTGVKDTSGQTLP